MILLNTIKGKGIKEFENDPVWHARILKGDEMQIGKKKIRYMRRKFGYLINKIAEKDKKVVLLVGDIGYGIFDDFRKSPKKIF